MVSVVIPAFEEEDAIQATIHDIQEVLAEIEHEILVIDDGSRDATGAKALTAGAKVIRHPHNLGYGAALKTGIKLAAFDTIVITDADGTYPNGDIPALLQEYGKGIDMVSGARTGKHYRESLLKAPLRRVLKWLVEFTTGRKIPDINCGFRVFSKKSIMPYFERLCNTFSFTTSLTLAYMMTNKFVTYMPIAYHKRIGKTKVRLFRDSLRTIQYIVQAILYYNPLKIFILMCGSILSLFFFCVFIAVVFKLTSAFYLGIGSILLAIQVFCLGLLAELLKQIMSNSASENRAVNSTEAVSMISLAPTSSAERTSISSN